MKKFISFVMAILLAVSCTACGDSSSTAKRTKETILKNAIDAGDSQFGDAIIEASIDPEKIKSEFIGLPVTVDSYILKTAPEANGIYLVQGGHSKRMYILAQLDRDAAMSCAAEDSVTVTGVISEVKREKEAILVVLAPAYLIKNEGTHPLFR